MLKIYNTLPEELKQRYTRTIKSAFDFGLNKDILLDPFVKEMIKDVDKSDVLFPNVIQSPILGAIPPTMLSGGVKALIVLYSRQWDLVLPTHLFGNNCAKWLVEMSKNQDVYLYTTSYLKLDEDIMVKGISVSLNDKEYKIENNAEYMNFFNNYAIMCLNGEAYEGVFR